MSCCGYVTIMLVILDHARPVNAEGEVIPAAEVGQGPGLEVEAAEAGGTYLYSERVVTCYFFELRAECHFLSRSSTHCWWRICNQTRYSFTLLTLCVSCV